MKRISTFLLLMCSIGMMAQNPLPSWQKTDHGVRIDATNGWHVHLTFMTHSIVKISKYQSDSEPADKSYAIILQPQVRASELSITEANGELTVNSSTLSLNVKLADGTVAFRKADGTAITTEKAGSTALIPTTDAGRATFKPSQAWLLGDEQVYGLGQRQSDILNHRGTSVHLQNSNTNICIPYFSTNTGWGIFWDNPSATDYVDNAEGLSMTSVVGEKIDYYFLYGGTQDGLIAGIRTLTGEATQFPLWTLGYWQCRERYKSSDELCDVLDKFRELRVPLDGIIQDWQYWGCDSNWNAMRFMNPHYINKMNDPAWLRYLPSGEDPNATYPQPRIKSPEEMVKYVHDHNAHLMITIWPDFGPWTDQYKEFQKLGALFTFETWPPNSGTRVYDAFNPKARDIYWKYMRNLYKMGFDAWWMDSTEPDHINVKPEDYDSPTHDGTWRAVQNAFPLVTNRGIYEHQRAEKGNAKRSFQMTRSGHFGEQHYGTLSWSGDISSNWQTLREQVISCQNFSLCGIPFWNSDIGGFFHWDYDNDPKNPAHQELQVRWLQWGCFMPLMRTHCSSPMVSEIWQFGEPGDWAFDVQKAFIKLRYRLIPYLYSAQGDVWKNHGSIIRPLVMDFASDRRAIESKTEYMFGRSMLVCPVTEALYTWLDENKRGHKIYDRVQDAAAPVKVYLPNGTKWYDFWTNRLYDGGRDIKALAPITKIPVYIKAGAIMPIGPDVQYTGEKAWDNLEVRVYAGADGEFTLYEDEGDTYNYERGAYSLIKFTWDDNAHCLTIADREGEYDGMLRNRKFQIVIINDGKVSEPKQIDYSGTSVNVKM